MRAGAFPERALAFLLAAYAIVSAWDVSGRPACIDYYQFWVVGRAVRAKETTDVYSPSERKRLGETYWQRAVAAESERLRDAPPSPADPSKRASPPPSKRLQAANQRKELETFSTPWFYTLFGVLAGDDYDASQNVFQRASLLAYVAAIVLLARMLGYSAGGACLWIAALLQFFNPFVDDTIAGNVNRLQLLALALFLVVAHGGWKGPAERGSSDGGAPDGAPVENARASVLRDLAGGFLLGATLAFKPNLVAIAGVLGLGWLVSGGTRRVVATAFGLVVGAATAVLLSAAFFDSLEPWRGWLSDLPRLLAPGSPSAGSAAEGNYSLARLLRDRAGISPGAVLPAALLALVAAALVAARVRRSRTGAAPLDKIARDVLLLGLGACITLLGSELAWQHYFVATIPLAMFLLRPVEDRVRPASIGLALAAIAMVALQTVGRLFDLHDPSAGAAMMAGGTLLLFLLGVEALARPRAA
jgi:hypothetical protein